MTNVRVSIKSVETGKRIEELIRGNGYKVRDIQKEMGFTTPQAIYKWFKGKSLPDIENLLILSKILHTSVEDLLVYDEDFFMLFTLKKTIFL